MPNTKVQVAPPSAPQAPAPVLAEGQGRGLDRPAPPVDPAACSTDPAKPVLEPEALQTINARSSDPSAKTAAALGIDGSGVKVGFIADGINPTNAGFLRTNGKSVDRRLQGLLR